MKTREWVLAGASLVLCGLVYLAGYATGYHAYDTASLRAQVVALTTEKTARENQLIDQARVLAQVKKQEQQYLDNWAQANDALKIVKFKDDCVVPPDAIKAWNGVLNDPNEPDATNGAVP